MRKLFTIASMVILSAFAFAQSENENVGTDTSNFPFWIEMMQNPNANFFETQKAFEQYWEGREITRGSGYKPFKRWESFMKTRVDEFGNKPGYSKNLDAYSQFMKQSTRKSAEGDWKLLGPVDLPSPESGQPNGLGRINVIAFHPYSENTIYIGAPSGGFWRSYDNGTTWETTSQNLPTLGVSAIVVNPKDPNIIYMGTGDRDANDAPGLGVYKSFDGGTTWAQKNSGMGNITVNKMLIHPNYPNIVLAATEKGVYKTVDAGETWKLKTSGSSKAMEFKPLNPDVIYAIKGGSLYKTVDNGESWKKLSNGLQSWSRAVIGVSNANPDYLYVLATNQRSFKALYFSENSGEIFTTKSTTPNIMDYAWNGSGDGGQAWYDLCMAVDHINPDEVYSGGVNIFKSTDQGKGWKINAHWVGQGNAPAVHADHHDMAFNPLNNRLYTANDGGLYYSDNGGTSWVNISDGISISQIYKIGQSATVRDWVLAGNQDNGTSFNDKGIWRVILGGDGMECIFDHQQEKYRYASLYYGAIYRSTNDGYFQPVSSGINDQGAWVTPYVLNEDSPKTMYVGMNSIWRTTNSTASTVSWKNISSSILSSYYVALENSPANSDILYASREDRKMFVSKNVNDASPTWSIVNGLPTSIITDIEAHPYDENIVYVTIANSQVRKSTNMGGTWTNITANLPSTNMNTIVYDKTSNEGLYVGTDIGVFYKDATMTNWIYYSNNFPVSGKVTELEIFYNADKPEENILRAATYGRGLWESVLYSEDITTANNARMIEVLEPIGEYNPSDSIEGRVTIKNIGSEKLTSVSMAYFVDNNSSKTVEFELDLETYETETVNLPKFLAGAGNHVLTIQLATANGSNVSTTLNTDFTVADANNISLSLETDLLASQTVWKIIDSDENVLFDSPTYLDDSAYRVFESLNLGTGCYKFVIDDTDGICCTNGNGSFTLTNETTNQLLGEGAEFLISDTVSFCIDTFPIPAFKVSKTTVEVDLPITFENQTVDNNYTYSWNFGPGAFPQTYEGETPTEVTYSVEGAKTVTLMATNNKNSVVKTQKNYIRVFAEPEITVQPKSTIICPAEKLELNVEAKGFELIYTWYRDGVKLSEKVTGLLNVENIQKANEGDYYCKISNKYFIVYSDTVAVSLNELPDLAVSLSDSVVCSGTEVTLTATGTGTIDWSNGLGSSAEVKDTPSTSITYIATLTNTEGCTDSKEVTVAVATTPIITESEADNKQICEDEGVVMLVDASGGSLKYLWKINEVDYISGSNVLYIDSVKPENQGDITCVVSNICGSEVANVGYLTVDPLPIAGFSFQKTGNTLQFVDEAQYANKYVWDFGDEATSTEIEPAHTFEDGSFVILQEVDNDCGNDTMSYKISLILGLEDNLLASEQLKIYPNPVQSTFNLEFNSGAYEGAVKVLMMNIEGKVILQEDLSKFGESILIPFNVTSYSKGLYQLQIILGDRVISRKLMIN